MARKSMEKMSPADYSAQFEPTAAERAAVANRAKSNATKSTSVPNRDIDSTASMPKQRTRAEAVANSSRPPARPGAPVVIQGVRNPLANAMNNASRVNAAAATADSTEGVIERGKALAKNVSDTIGRIMKHGQHRAPSEVVGGKRRTK